MTAKEPMTTRQYLRALKQLGLTVAGKATAEVLGLSLRQCQRMAAGEAPIPGPVEKLIKLYLKHGIDDA
jgi:hypothetical protein